MAQIVKLLLYFINISNSVRAFLLLKAASASLDLLWTMKSCPMTPAACFPLYKSDNCTPRFHLQTMLHLTRVLVLPNLLLRMLSSKIRNVKAFTAQDIANIASKSAPTIGLVKKCLENEGILVFGRSRLNEIRLS